MGPSTRAATQAKLVKEAAYYASKGKQAREALEAKHQEALEAQAENETSQAREHDDRQEPRPLFPSESTDFKPHGEKALIYYGKAVIFNALFCLLINYAWTPSLFKSENAWDIYIINYFKAIGL